MAIIAGVTGHRPPRLGLGYDEKSCGLLRDFAVMVLESFKPDKVITGMAQGWDRAIAEAAIQKNIPFVAALPFIGQESKWPYQAQKSYREILSKAESQHVVKGSESIKRKYLLRDEWVCREASLLIALFDGRPEGGTYYTVKYAEKIGTGTINVWKEWENYRGSL